MFGVKPEIVLVGGAPGFRSPVDVTVDGDGQRNNLRLSDRAVRFLLQNFWVVADCQLHFVQRPRITAFHTERNRRPAIG